MTAVEWYSNKLVEILGDMCNEFTQEQTLANHYALKQANELFQQQIIEAYDKGYIDGDTLLGYEYFDDSESYYKKTYKPSA